MNLYYIKFADGSTEHMSGRDHLHASERAADLWPERGGVVAWRVPTAFVTHAHHSQIIG
jgi:hypothetical protein